MHSKGGNGVNIADEFRSGTVKELPASTAPVKRVLDETLIERCRVILTGADGAMISAKQYTATAEELTAWNTKAKEEGRDALTGDGALEALAHKIAYNASSVVFPYAMAAAEPLHKTISRRIFNEGTKDKPAFRWAFVLAEPKKKASKGTDTVPAAIVAPAAPETGTDSASK